MHPWKPKPYSETKNPRGYFISEKFDGISVVWNGADLISSGAKRIKCPDWWLADLPAMPSGIALQGELWAGRGGFGRVLSAAQGSASEGWSDLRIVAFDLHASGSFEERNRCLSAFSSKRVMVARQRPCAGRDDMKSELARVVSAGGEGIVLHHPSAYLSSGPTWAAMKVKPRYDEDADVEDVAPNKSGVTLSLRDNEGARFSLSVFSGETISRGEAISFWHDGRTARGVPRHPRFMRVRGQF